MLALLAVLAAGPAAPRTETFIVDGAKREAIVFAPSKPSPHPPMVFAFHGHGGNMQGSVNLYRLQTLWPEAVVVYPQGLPSPSPGDPQAQRSGWQFNPGDQNDRDLKFFDAMYQKLSQEFHFDPKRAYSLGFSNGGVFTYLLWHSRGARIAAGGIVEAIVGDPVKPLTPLPALIVAGQQDTTAPYDKQLESIKYVKAIEGVAGSPGTPHPGLQRYHGSNADLAVMIHTGGHVYPPNTSALAVQFFRNHPQP